MKYKSILVNTVLVFFGLIIAIIIAEIFLILLPYQPKALIPPYLYDNHATTQWTLRPGFSVDHKSLDGVVTYQINAQGLRSDKVYTRIKPLDGKVGYIPRIFVIGDSYTFGWGVNEYETFPRFLEKLLTSQGMQYEVINLGVPGFGTSQSYMRLLEYADLGLPDIVIYMFCPNDPTDNIVRNKVVVDGVRMDAKIKYKHLAAMLAKIYQHSRFLALVLDTYYSIKINPRLAKQQELAKQQIDGRDDVVSLISELKNLQSWTNGKDINFLVMTTSDSEYSPILKRYLSETNTSMLDSEHVFLEHNLKPEEVKLLYDGHWNSLGHKVVAEAINDFLLKNQWVATVKKHE